MKEDDVKAASSPTTVFSLQFLQALSDYQRGGDSAKRGAVLKPLAELLPERFRTCDKRCFRQEAHGQRRVWDLLIEHRLPMRYSSWTTSLEAAKVFKGGVTPNGQGVIIAVFPPKGSVILNLNELYNDTDFLSALEDQKDHIKRYADGAGRYGNSQCEVVLDLDTGTPGNIVCLGGFVGNAWQIAQFVYGRQPLIRELLVVKRALNDAGITSGDDWWLSSEGSKAVWDKIQEHAPRLKAKKRIEDALKLA